MQIIEHREAFEVRSDDGHAAKQFPFDDIFFSGVRALRATLRIRRRAFCVLPLTLVPPRVAPPETVQTPRAKTLWHLSGEEDLRHSRCLRQVPRRLIPSEVVRRV
jgi:hypothetical protein